MIKVLLGDRTLLPDGRLTIETLAKMANHHFFDSGHERYGIIMRQGHCIRAYFEMNSLQPRTMMHRLYRSFNTVPFDKESKRYLDTEDNYLESFRTKEYRK